jgi:diaminopimelate decarboxylase
MTTPVWKSVSELNHRNGILHLEGIAIPDLARTFGTPLYVYSYNRIKKNYHRLVNAYRAHYPHFEVYYAIKANNNPAIVKLLAEEGAGADASCIPEILIAKQAGIPDHRILYSGVYNSDHDLRYAVDHRTRLNLEDLSQLYRLEKISIPEFLSFRINPGMGESGIKGLVFAGPDAKFGIIEPDVEKAYTQAKEWGVKRFGIHMMTGSNVLNPHYFEQVVIKLLDIAGPLAKKLGIQFEFIDIGGSLGVPYRPEEEELDVNQVAQSVVRALRAKLKEYHMGEPTLIHEPGRYLVCDAGVLVASVASIKQAHKTFIGLDAGMQTLLRPALHGAYHHILYSNNLNAPCDRKVNVVGQICESTDTFAKDAMLPSATAIGDQLVFLNAGAYGYSMSSQYNSKMRPAEVLVKDGQACLIRKREQFDDLIKGTQFAVFS